MTTHAIPMSETDTEKRVTVTIDRGQGMNRRDR